MREVSAPNSEAESQEHIGTGAGVPQADAPAPRTHPAAPEAESAAVLPPIPGPSHRTAARQTVPLLAADGSCDWSAEL